MTRAPNLQTLLDASTGRVSTQKLLRLESTLRAAFNKRLDTIIVDDPMVIRRAMIKHLRTGRVTAGNLQAMEQFYMGIVRRAAVEGLLAAPPEGPWTRAWQSVIDIAGGKSPAKALLRSLAGWATDKDVQPDGISAARIREWASSVGCEADNANRVVDVLSEWRETKDSLRSFDTAALDERLRRKAKCGTVRTESS